MDVFQDAGGRTRGRLPLIGLFGPHLTAQAENLIHLLPEVHATDRCVRVVHSTQFSVLRLTQCCASGPADEFDGGPQSYSST
jgi:hypothetical protein